MPGLSADTGYSNWANAVDQTTHRTSGTQYTAGTHRRICLIQASCAATVTDSAEVTVATVCWGATFTGVAAGFPAGVIVTGIFTVPVLVDPGAHYTVTVDPTVTISAWWEIDL